MDLHDIEPNTADVVQFAALTGGWIAAACGLAGLYDHGGELRFARRPLPPVRRLAFTLIYGTQSLAVEVMRDVSRVRAAACRTAPHLPPR